MSEDINRSRHEAISLKSTPYPVLITLIILFYFTLLFTTWKFPAYEEEGFLLSLFLYLIFCLLPALILYLKPGLVRHHKLPPVLFLDDCLRLPLKTTSNKTVSVPYEDIIALSYRGSGDHSFYSIDTRSHTIHLPRNAFLTDEDWITIHQLIVEKLAGSKSHNSFIRTLKEQEEIRSKADARIPLVTFMLSFLLLLIFTIQHASNTYSFVYIAGIGANSSILLKEGEWFRLLTSGFLHSGYLHLCLNLLGVFVLGYVIERLIGSIRFTIIYFLSLIGGSFFSALGGTALSVGASTGIFGLLGAFFWLHISQFRSLPSGFRIPMKWWIYIAAADIALPLLIPRIDFMAHGGGFLTGLLLAAMLIGYRPLLQNSRPPLAIKIVAAAVVFCSVYVFCTAYESLKTPAARALANIKVIESLLSEESWLPEELNHYAWTQATASEPFVEEIILATTAIEKALSKESSYNRIDTYATLQYRLGNFKKAAEEELLIFEKSLGKKSEYEKLFFGGQLIRFMDPVVKIGDVPIQHGVTSTCSFSWVQDESTLRISRNEECNVPVSLYFHFAYSNQPSEMLRVPLNSPGSSVTVSPELRSASTTLAAIIISTEGEEKPYFFSVDEQVSVLPSARDLKSLASAERRG